MPEEQSVSNNQWGTLKGRCSKLVELGSWESVGTGGGEGGGETDEETEAKEVS